jgi:glycosyltransferase involved in cell wall biosynthesis
VVTGPHISVIIPARDAAPTIARTLAALQSQDIRHPYEVVVVDDGSTDETAEIARGFEPLVKLVRNRTSEGPGAGRNRGAHAAHGRILAFTDADCFPTPEWLRKGCQALGEAELVQGRVVPDPAFQRTPFDRSLSVENELGFYQTANLFVRRETFDTVGGFRDWALEQPRRRRWSTDRRRNRAMRTPIGEDTVFAWSARRQGSRSTFAPEAIVHHEVVPGTIRDAMADQWHWTRDMPGLVRRVPELRRSAFYRRVFFGSWTAYFDLALVGLAGALLTRRKLWLAAILPYGRRVMQDAGGYSFGRGPRAVGRSLGYAVGTPAVDAVSLGGFLFGTIAWRCLVL